MKTLKVLFFILLFTQFACNSNKVITEIEVINITDLFIADAFIVAELTETSGTFSLIDNGMEVPYQITEVGGSTKLCFVIDLGPNEVKKINVISEPGSKEMKFNSRTYAELAMKPGNVYVDGKFRGDRFENVTKIKVPEIHTDHDALFKYEGPGWESEKIGYRFYLDWRNATDIFGKKTNDLILHNVGIHDTVAKDDSYHQMQDWGMDVFKVGRSLGIGSIAMWQNGKVNMVSKTDSIYCEIVENGPVRSLIRTNYFGWLVGENKYNLESNFSIAAGSRLTKVQLTVDNSADSLATGLAKFEGTNFIKSDTEDEWAYIALYGNQTLVNENDKLGIAVFYKTSSLYKITEDDLSYVLILHPEDDKLEYYFGAAWEQEPNGITSESDFITYLNHTLSILNNPPIIK